jgi:hypothetical protein
MIKREPNLSIECGGTVFKSGKNGRQLKLGTHCRLFQTLPVCWRSMLCVGFTYYPPCPDLSRCLSMPRPKTIQGNE